jgi:hypothetical protein
VTSSRSRTLVFAGAAVIALVVGAIAARVALAPAHPGTVSPGYAETASSAHVGTAFAVHGGTASAAPAPRVIDPSAGDTFAPAPAGAAPALTAAQAWAQYVQANGGKATIPSGLAARLGLVSVPVGPVNPDDPDQAGLATSNGMAYRALNELAYGYSSPTGSCPMSRNPNNPGPVGKSCIDWTFVDANTGQLIEETWQILS